MYNVCNLLGFQTGKCLHKNHSSLDILQGLEQTKSISQQVYLLLTVFYYLSCIRAHIHIRNSVHMRLGPFTYEKFKSIYSGTKYSEKNSRSITLPSAINTGLIVLFKTPYVHKRDTNWSFFLLFRNDQINFVQAEIKTIHTGAISNCTSWILSTICYLCLFIQLFLENIQVTKKSGESNGNWYWSKLFRIQGSNLFHQ